MHRSRVSESHQRTGWGGGEGQLLALAKEEGMGVGGISRGWQGEIPAIAPPSGDVLGLKEWIIRDWWSPADDPVMPTDVFIGAHFYKRHRWRCVRQQCPAGRPSTCILTSFESQQPQVIKRELAHINLHWLSLTPICAACEIWHAYLQMLQKKTRMTHNLNVRKGNSF